jgi:hypothetical protein
LSRFVTASGFLARNTEHLTEQHEVAGAEFVWPGVSPTKKRAGRS